jgi:hypothetical protein
MSRRFQFSLWQLMLVMTGIAVGSAWIPRIFPYGSGSFTIFLAAALPLPSMFFVGRFFRGVTGFVTGIVVCLLPCFLLSVLCEVLVAATCQHWFGISLRDSRSMMIGILIGGPVGGAVTSFLAGAVGGIMAILYDELS